MVSFHFYEPLMAGFFFGITRILVARPNIEILIAKLLPTDEGVSPLADTIQIRSPPGILLTPWCHLRWLYQSMKRWRNMFRHVIFPTLALMLL